MLADECAPSHAESLTQSLGYARRYAIEIQRMLAEGNVNPEWAARLVQAIRNMILAALDDLDVLDDVQQEIDAVREMQSLTDEELFRALSGGGTPHAE
ncbi:hypothetical protein OG243_33275 [Streptomyces sp. NBC_01318]|uniref:hypothetical protein n=1 Tax=Streptomyces sp. NBC_01318 TaxID=2903823 RepID=UPI002E0D7EE9|nr:hypothetical protein OG243_33275 [Streptomyces sp. NBC_01318]